MINYPVPPQSVPPDPLTGAPSGEFIPVPLDTSVPPLYVEQGQLDAGTVHTALAREYVWGTGDGFVGVDELLVQFDEGRQAWWVLQDASGDIIAQVKSHPTTGPPEDPENRALPSLAARYDYDPYGKVTTAWLDDTLDVPSLAAGHKGLFFDNLNESRVYLVASDHQPMTLADLLLGVREQRHTAWAEPVYHVRNRNLMPRYGRWLQRDMNATGAVVMHVQPGFACASMAAVAGQHLGAQYLDGSNLHGYVGSNPWTRRDADGLLIGFMTGNDTLISLELSMAKTALSGLQLVQQQLALGMVKYYSQMAFAMGVMDGATAEFSGGISPFGATSHMLYESVASLAGRNADELLSLTARHFRENMQLLTRFSGRVGTEFFFDAHHIIPQPLREQFLRLGVNIDNPIFGQWMEQAAHDALHASDAYLVVWQRFASDLEVHGVTGTDAIKATMRFIKEDIAPKFGFQVPY